MIRKGRRIKEGREEVKKEGRTVEKLTGGGGRI